MQRIKFLIILTLVLIPLTLVVPEQVDAFSFNEAVTKLKNFFVTGKKEAVPTGSVSVESDISLALNGDKNVNGKIDSGDIVSFSYQIINTSSNEYTFGTLHTNINKSNINFIHNVQATSLNDDGKTVNFPNIRLMVGQIVHLSFDARINYSDNDIVLSTEPEFITQDQQSLVKSLKKEVKAAKLDKAKIDSMQRSVVKKL